jgi:membrane protein DedA with SNARE-associated domain
VDFVGLAESLVASHWFYVVLASVAMLDSFLPLVPSEPVIILAGVFVGAGDASLTLVVLAVGIGAFLGDQIPYGVGWWLGQWLESRLPPGTRRRAVHDWMAQQLHTRGGIVLLTTRFIPVGRYLATLTTGMVRYSYRNYLFFTLLGGLAWSAYTVLSGYLGGKLFQDNVVLATVAGIGVAIVLSGVIELIRKWRFGGKITGDVPHSAGQES